MTGKTYYILVEGFDPDKETALEFEKSPFFNLKNIVETAKTVYKDNNPSEGTPLATAFALNDETKITVIEGEISETIVASLRYVQSDLDVKKTNWYIYREGTNEDVTVEAEPESGKES